MGKRNRWRNGMCGLLLGWLALVPGCMYCRYTLPPMEKERIDYCASLPQPCRSRVFVFFLQGSDPLGCSNLWGLREHLHSLGFIKTYYGYWHHVPHFGSEIRRLRQEDPETRFVLIGFGKGGNAARDLAASLQGEGIGIDLLVYLGSATIHGQSSPRPENVVQVVNIRGQGCWQGKELSDASNLVLPATWHYGAAVHPMTIDVLTQELVAVACRVPYIEPVPPALPPSETAPQPRREHRTPPKAERDEWDFLKPAPLHPALPTQGGSR